MYYFVLYRRQKTSPLFNCHHKTQKCQTVPFIALAECRVHAAGCYLHCHGWGGSSKAALKIVCLGNYSITKQRKPDKLLPLIEIDKIILATTNCKSSPFLLPHHTDL